MSGVSGAAIVAALVGAMVATRAGAQTPAQSGATSVDAAARRAATLRPAPGDRIRLKIHREAELSDTGIVVDARGDAVFPKLGLVPVGRFTMATLRDSLRARYSRYLRDPDLEVVVLRRITVSGEVRAANVMFIEPTSTLRDVIARANGLTGDGDPKRLTVVRDGERIRVPDWRRVEGDAFELRSGDQVVVGTKPWLVRNALGLASTAAIVVSVTTAVIRGS
ncbi:MAG TPA: polysaccharide biosynthesis/export family protein [Gemmatimonadaceae bacterium]|nr:polysaccharide biosynthesis/export family protein [Gemmatimonadaceae bacterium]